MPLYGSPQAGSRQWDPTLGLTPAQMAGKNITTISPGESLMLFDGTETPDGAPITSIAIARGLSPAAGAAGPITFSIDYATTPTAVLYIQASNRDVEADYQTIYTSTSPSAVHDLFTDANTAWLFYRAKLYSYSGGGMPVVIAQR